VGNSGKIYALDIHPSAISSVKDIIAKKKLTNVETILSACKTGLPDNSIDVVLLYDILHELSEPSKVLKELRRILKPEGIISISDHHLKEDEIVPQVTKGGLFRLYQKGKKTYSFLKEEQK
jgi:ubiquinone/menaquinone biosynthesis C-methylase UbiE